MSQDHKIIAKVLIEQLEYAVAYNQGRTTLTQIDIDTLKLLLSSK